MANQTIVGYKASLSETLKYIRRTYPELTAAAAFDKAKEITDKHSKRAYGYIFGGDIEELKKALL